MVCGGLVLTILRALGGVWSCVLTILRALGGVWSCVLSILGALGGAVIANVPVSVCEEIPHDEECSDRHTEVLQRMGSKSPVMEWEG